MKKTPEEMEILGHKAYKLLEDRIELAVNDESAIPSPELIEQILTTNGILEGFTPDQRRTVSRIAHRQIVEVTQQMPRCSCCDKALPPPGEGVYVAQAVEDGEQLFAFWCHECGPNVIFEDGQKPAFLIPDKVQ